MQFTGEAVNAERALAIGLANQVVAHDELLPASLTLAQKIARWSSYSLALNKLLLRKAQQESFTDHLWEAQRALALAQAGPDQRFCAGGSTTLDASGSSIPDCPGGLEYQWSVGGTPVAPWSTTPTLPVTPAATSAGVTGFGR